MTCGARWPSLVFAIVVLLNCVAGAVLLAWPKGEMTPLATEQGWTTTGRMFATSINAAPALPRAMVRSPALRLWRSWSTETGPTQGSIATAAFNRQPYLAIPFYGFPGEVAGNTISLRCVADGRAMTVADMRTNTEWSIAYLHVPKSFCPGQLQLQAASLSGRFIVGIGTPFKISVAAYYAAKAFPVRGLVLTLAWAWFAVLIGCCGIAGQLFLGRGDPLAMGFAGMGLFGLVAFFLYHFSPSAGSAAASAASLLVPCAAAALIRWKPAATWHFVRAHGTPFLLWLVIAWTYAALVGAIDNGGGSWSVNAAFSPARWSSDNQVPFQFAEAMYNGTPRDQIRWGDWLASDRPPLLSGLLLLVRPAIGAFAAQVNRDFVSTLYMTVSIVLMSSWVLPVYRFGQAIRPRDGRYLVAAGAITPFFLFNSVYVWPKLLGASYALFVFLELAGLSARRPGRGAVVLASVCAALSILSHASNAVIFPVLALLFARPVMRHGIVTICLAVAAAAGVLLPWQIWQATVQPHGNALLRYALSGDFGMADRTKAIMPSIIAAYRSLGLAGWIALKLDGIMIMLGSMRPSGPLREAASYGPGVDSIGDLRVADFFSVLRAMGIPAIGLLLLPVAFNAKFRLVDRLVAQAAICGAGAIALSLLVFVPAPITHQLPYAGVALLLLAGASALGAWPAARLAALAAAAGYFLVVWVAHPLVSALRIETCAAYALAGGLVSMIDHAWLSRRKPDDRRTAT